MFGTAYIQKDMFEKFGGKGRTGVTENKILRLAFHDCVGYEEGGVCDGCLNWKGVGHKNPDSHLDPADQLAVQVQVLLCGRFLNLCYVQEQQQPHLQLVRHGLPEQHVRP